MIDPQQLINNEESLLLNDNETNASKELESWIDNQILSTFTNRKATVQEIDYAYDKTLILYKALLPVRQKIVKQVTLERYRKLWKIDWHDGYSDCRDSSPGYWVFTPLNPKDPNK
jgi:hypothetical protein